MRILKSASIVRVMDKLREWLELTGISPSRLSLEIGASPNSVGNWLSGRSHPRLIYVRKLHNRTSIPLEDLIPADEARSQ